MPSQYTSAGADAAGQYDDQFRQLIANDPDIQRVIQRVWGTTPVTARPSDTPKHLEQANKAASQEIGQILARKGIPLPDRTFVNPRSGALEGHRGWAGLSGLQKALAIAAAAGAGGLGALAATGALAGGAGAGAAGAAGGGLGVTTGLPAGFGAATATGIGAGGAAVGGGGALTGLLTNAGINAGLTKARGGSWTDALISAGTGAALPGGGGGMNWTSLLTNPELWGAIGTVAGGAASGKSDQRMQESATTNAANNTQLAAYQTQQAAQNQAAQLDLQRKMFSEDARGGRTKQALLADLLSNLQDISIDVPGVTKASITGGLRASAIGDQGRQSLAELRKQALQAQLGGDTFSGGEILTPPTLAAMPKKGGVESALDWIGLLGSGFGALGGGQAQQPATYSQLPSAQGAQAANTPNYNPNLYRDLRF